MGMLAMFPRHIMINSIHPHIGFQLGNFDSSEARLGNVCLDRVRQADGRRLAATN